MYLISVYFDKETNGRIQKYIDRVADRSGNTFMTDGRVPPHITVSSFETRQEECAVRVVEKIAAQLKSGKLTWCSVGVFLPYVIYIAPVLNEYLQKMAEKVYDGVREIEDAKISLVYQPMQWLPHTTIGKKLSKDEMQKAFSVLQEQFGVFEGRVTHIGLARTNPYEALSYLELQ